MAKFRRIPGRLRLAPPNNKGASFATHAIADVGFGKLEEGIGATVEEGTTGGGSTFLGRK